MTMQALLLEAVEQRLLRHLDVQFAMMVAGEEPAVMPYSARSSARDCVSPTPPNLAAL